MTNGKFVVRGTIRRREDRTAVAGLLVEAYDADLLLDDKLGSSVTDRHGTFRIPYQASDFRDLFERRPDIYLVVRDREDRKLHSTRARVRVNAGREEYFLIELSRTTLGEAPIGTDIVGGLQVDSQAFNRVAASDLIALARAYRGKNILKRRLKLFREVSPLLVSPLVPAEEADRESVESGNCLTPQILFIESALRHLNASQQLFDELDAELFDLPLEAELWETAHFRIHYRVWTGDADAWTADTGTVLPIDAPAEEVRLYNQEETLIGTTQAGIGTTTYIQKLAIWLEHAFERYTHHFQFRDPQVGGAKITVSVEHLQGAVTGLGSNGYIVVRNNLSDPELAGTSVHELFHCVQSQYLSNTDSTSPMEAWDPFMVEGMSRCMEDMINDRLNGWMASANYFFMSNYLEAIGLPDMRYSAALFWKYMTEQHSTSIGPAHEPAIGVDVIRKACEMAETISAADIRVPILLRAERRVPYFGTFSHFIYLPPGNKELSTNETTYGNWLAANYLQCLRGTIADRRFTYMEADESSYDDRGLHCMTPTSSDDLEAGAALNLENAVAPWSGSYHEVRLGQSVTTVRLTFDPEEDFAGSLIQVILVEQGNTFRDLVRFEGGFTKTVDTQGLDRIAIVVGARAAGGSYTLRAESIASASDVMITRWNSIAGQEHEFDPIGWSWHWISPDVWVDNYDGESDLAEKSLLRFEWDNPRGGSNHLYVRLRNKGNRRADNVVVRFSFQDASAGLRDNAWRAMQANAGGAPSQLSGLSLEPGEEIRPFVSWWLPKPDSSNPDSSFHYCVKVDVISAGDENSDNKLALSNFSFVEEPSPEIPPQEFDVIDPRVWADWLPRMELYPHVPEDFYIWRDSLGMSRTVDTYLIARNDLSLVLNQRDFLALNHVGVRDILGETAVVYGEGSPAPTAPGGDGAEERERSAASRVYRLRFALEKVGAALPAHLRRYQTLAHTLPPGVEPAHVQVSPDPRSLPPGLADIPMATLVQAVDGQITGGITFAIVARRSEPMTSKS